MSDLQPAPAPTAQRPPTGAGQRLSWFARGRRRAVDSAAQRAHDALAKSDRPGLSTSSAGLMAYCIVVVAVAAIAVLLLVWATFQPKNLIGWIAVLLGWLAVYEMFPRRERAEVRELPVPEFPHVNRLVRDLADIVGVEPPGVVAVDTTFNAYVVHSGWRRDSMLVLGLPLWTALPPDQRAALLAHELGHLRGRATGRARVTNAAHSVLSGLATLLTPLPRDAYSEFYMDYATQERSQAFSNAMGAGLLRVVSLPFVGLLLAFERLAAVESQRTEYLADLSAARAVGTDAAIGLLAGASNRAGLHTLANAAVRRREDPFAVLEEVANRPALSESQLVAAMQRANAEELRWDDSHPRDDLRMSLLMARPVIAEPGILDAMPGAGRELASLRPELAGRLRADLLED